MQQYADHLVQYFHIHARMILSTMTDATLVARALACPDDYAAIVEQYEKMLLRFVRTLSRLSSADAEDIVQSVFIKAYEHLNDFDTDLKLSTWLLRIARNEVIDHWRRKNVRPQESELDEPLLEEKYFAENTLAAELDQKITAEEVRHTLALLKADYREVLYLYYFEDKTYEEIADIIRRPAGTVAALLNRAKKAFAELAKRTANDVLLASA